jgi:DNA mismatch repair protein MutL
LARIARLPDDLVNKIAAGEVVERPASVAKELLENAVDAGARSVLLEIESGGRTLLRARDDGAGMGREDVLLAIERHATSKIRSLSDLAAIATHGFRGEALASIASVSHLLLTSREEGNPAGTQVEVRNGELLGVREAGHPRGTTVEVRDLFGAVPARRKFLRADATESSHVAEAVTLSALARPGLGLRLVSGGRKLIDAPAVADLEARVYQLFGTGMLQGLTPVDGGRDWVRLRGLVSRPERSAASRPTLRLFVNGRPVRDRALSKAVSEAYRAAGVGFPRPEGFLFLEAPHELVDVNVHPAKTEVRFADPRLAYDAVVAAVREALARGSSARARSGGAERVREAVEGYLARPEPSGRGSFGPGAGAGWRPEPPLATRPAPRAVGGDEALLFEPGGPSVLGQHRNTYILATDGEDLLLVDQHTAHERVRFEQLQRARVGGRLAGQGLLAPAVHHLAPRLRPLLEACAGELAAAGFEVEPFGGDAVSLRTVPALLAGRDPGLLLEALLADLADRESGDWAVSDAASRVLATVACHSAVRAGQPLSPAVMTEIVRGLGQTEHPGLCPHGRPTLVRIPREDVSRWFGRSGWRRE